MDGKQWGPVVDVVEQWRRPERCLLDEDAAALTESDAASVLEDLALAPSPVRWD